MQLRAVQASRGVNEANAAGGSLCALYLPGSFFLFTGLLAEMLGNAEVHVVDITECAAALSVGVSSSSDSNDADQIPVPLQVHQQLDPAVFGSKAAYHTHTTRPGAAYNDALVKRTSRNAFKQGSIDNARWILQPSSAAAAVRNGNEDEDGEDDDGGEVKLQLTPNPHQAPIILMRQRSTFASNPAEGLLVAGASAPAAQPIGGWLALITASDGDTHHILNWLCWAHRHSFSNFLFLARDAATARLLKRLDVPFLAHTDDAPQDAAAEQHESASFLQWKLRLVREALNGEISVFIAPARTVWPRSPLQLFHHLTYGAAPSSAPSETEVFPWLTEGAPVEKNRAPVMSADILALRPTNLGHFVAQQTALCLDRELDEAHTHGSANATVRWHGNNDEGSKQRPDPSQLLDTCLSSVIWSARGNLKWSPLVGHDDDAPLLFVTSTSFFEKQLPQAKGVEPFLVDLRQKATNDASSDAASTVVPWVALQQWHLDAVAPDAHQDAAQSSGPLSCLPPPAPKLPPKSTR